MLNKYGGSMKCLSLSAKSMLFLGGCFFILAFFSPSAQALIELKGSYSLLTTSPGDINSYSDTHTYPHLGGMTGIGADVLVSLPTMPVGLGVRYETFAQSVSSSTYDAKSSFQRVSVIVDSRWIDTLAYLGFLATFGVTNDFKLTETAAGVDTVFKSNGGFSATAGLEGGLKLLLLRVGAEAGYMYAPLGDLKDSNGAAVTNNSAGVKTDLSGPYVRATIGFGF
jgi:hypothetical protein